MGQEIKREEKKPYNQFKHKGQRVAVVYGVVINGEEPDTSQPPTPGNRSKEKKPYFGS